MSDTVYKLQKRVEQYSTEAQVYQEGSDRINVEIPGVTDANAILEELGQPGSLCFITQQDEDGNANFQADSSSETGYSLARSLDEIRAAGRLWFWKVQMWQMLQAVQSSSRIPAAESTW